jgi:hypothetical protein
MSIDLRESERAILVAELQRRADYWHGCADTNLKLAEKARAGGYAYLRAIGPDDWLATQPQKFQDQWNQNIIDQNNPEWWLARATRDQEDGDKYQARADYFRSLWRGAR